MSSTPAPDVPPPPPPVAPMEAGLSTEIKPEDRTMAMLCHLLCIVTWFVGPLVIWLIKKDQSKYVDEQGREALNFQITLLIGDAIGVATSCLGVGVFIIAAVWIIRLVFCILAAIAVNKGEHYRYPLAIRLI